MTEYRLDIGVLSSVRKTDQGSSFQIVLGQDSWQETRVILQFYAHAYSYLTNEKFCEVILTFTMCDAL